MAMVPQHPFYYRRPTSPEEVVDVARRFRPEWAKIAVSTERADRHRAEGAVCQIEQSVSEAGRWRPVPRNPVRWVESPGAAAQLVFEYINDYIDGSVRRATLADLRLGSHLISEYADTYLDEILRAGTQHSGLTNHLSEGMARVRSTTPIRTGGSIAAVINAAAPPRMMATGPAGVNVMRFCVSSQFNATTHLLSDVVSYFDGSWHRHLADFARHGGMLWMLPHVNVACERPSMLKFDDQERVHCADGPAVTYRDGWEVYAWHGVYVPKDMIMGAWSVSRIYRGTQCRGPALCRGEDGLGPVHRRSQSD